MSENNREMTVAFTQENLSQVTSIGHPHVQHLFKPSLFDLLNPPMALLFPKHPFGFHSFWGFEEECEMPETGGRRLEAAAGGRRKRRRGKNKEEVESQRMTHIVVERNRRKQMNHYLALLRSLMPSSFVQRADQASIVGGAINFVKELEHLLQATEAQNQKSGQPPFAHFFTFPQYSTSSPSSSSSGLPVNDAGEVKQRRSAAEIEVTVVETHAHIKILSKKWPRQLLKMVSVLQTLKLAVLHLNATSFADNMVLYSVSVKVEEGSQVNTVDEIAAAVNEMLWRIQAEASLIIT